MNSATRATGPFVRVVSLPLLSTPERDPKIHEKISAIKWAVLFHLLLIATLVLCKTTPPGQFDEFLVDFSEPYPWVPPTCDCPPLGPPIQKATSGPPPSSVPPKPETAALPKLDITSIDAEISYLLNSATYNVLNRGSFRAGTSMFDPAPFNPSAHSAHAPDFVRSVPFLPPLHLFSPLANPGAATIADFCNRLSMGSPWTIRDQRPGRRAAP